MAATLSLRALIVLVCAAGVVGSLIVYRSDERIRNGFNEMTIGGSSDSTLRKLEDADSWLNPDSRRELGIAGVLVRRGRGAEAEAVLREALRREPENALLWVGLARVLVTTGRRAAAERSYDRARSLNTQIPRQGLPAPLGS